VTDEFVIKHHRLWWAHSLEKLISQWFCHSNYRIVYLMRPNSW